MHQVWILPKTMDGACPYPFTAAQYQCMINGLGSFWGKVFILFIFICCLALWHTVVSINAIEWYGLVDVIRLWNFVFYLPEQSYSSFAVQILKWWMHTACPHI